MSETTGPYRDGAVHVVEDKCATCIFRPGNLMNLRPGRLREMSREAVADQSVIVCHSTLPEVAESGGVEAVCRGYFDAHAHDVTPLRLALAADFIAYDPPVKAREVRA